MLFFGHRFIESEKFYHVSDIDAVVKTPPNAIIYLEFDEANLDIIEYLRINGISFALGVKTLQEVLYANALESRYIITDEILCKEAQQIAQEYLFDAKILVRIESDEEIERFAKLGIDGVIYPEAIVKIPT
ncbi:hypothetical protein MNB_SM-7-781 [hydrothermal vent metagenome]|uniref:GP-PDE domain-containing protein n=1 Tax=hydrothermal vent metagenome TaxID=652676 RepID=A0A1W1C450_9ZZZZ